MKAQSQRSGSVLSNQASVLRHFDADAEMPDPKQTDLEDPNTPGT